MNSNESRYRFWLEKTLYEMTEEEWEQLCDGCGLCCLNKLIDSETNEIYFTNVACDGLDRQTCLCKHYADRFNYQQDCIKLTKGNVAQIPWLPKTCAYYLLLYNKPLPEWHPLIVGHKNAMPKKLTSMKCRIIYEKDVICWEDHIIALD